MDRDMILRAVVRPPLWATDPRWPSTIWMDGFAYQLNMQDNDQWLMTTPEGSDTLCQSLELAQAAAETDHRTRIAEAINLNLVEGLVEALEAIAGYNNMPGVEWRAKHPELSAGFDISRRAKLGAGTALAVYARDRLAAFRAAGGEVG
jgi:hypothetical protein